MTTPDAPLIAHVAVDVPLPHLDRVFDYAVTPAQAADVAPGVRVRVRFAGKLRDGYVMAVDHSTDVAAPAACTGQPPEVGAPDGVATDGAASPGAGEGKGLWRSGACDMGRSLQAAPRRDTSAGPFRRLRRSPSGTRAAPFGRPPAVVCSAP